MTTVGHELPSSADVDAALLVIRRHFGPSPIRTVDGVACKLEGTNPTGSFKVRGALAALSASAAQGVDRVVAASAGNHGSGIAFAAGVLGMNAVVVVPSDCPAIKLEKMRSLGATVRVSAARGYDDAELEARELAATEGVPFVSPFLGRHVMAGNGGTIARELLEAVPDLQTVVVPVGGGGLFSGLVVEFQRLRPQVEVVAAQSAACPAFVRSLRDGVVYERWDGETTLAEGLEGGTGAIGVGLARAAGTRAYEVSEAAIASAMRRVWRSDRLAIEGSSAVALALDSGVSLPAPCVHIVSGSNVSESVLDGLRD